MSLPLSFEFFPPKTPEGAAKLRAVRQQLYVAEPEFCSVTYGAGGSTQDGTLPTVQAILDERQQRASHFSCIGATRESVREQLAVLKAMGVRRLVALRGDLPSGYGASGEFQYASRPGGLHPRRNRRRISTSRWPPTPRCIRRRSSPEADLQAFVPPRCKAGARSAITQYFFNSDAYFRFVEDTYQLGAELPVVPGIMPITNSTQLMRFSDACGAEIPRWIRLRLQAYGDDTASIKAFGLDVVDRPVRPVAQRRRARLALLHHEPERTGAGNPAPARSGLNSARCP